MGLSPTASHDVFVVRRSEQLQGVVPIPGAKNSVLKLMAASILAEGETVLSNVPHIADVPVMLEILGGLGAYTELDGEVAVIRFDDVPHWEAPEDAVGRIRASISCLGPMVGRLKRCRIALPGGDKIGKRGIEMHLDGLRAMGAEVTEYDGGVEVQADELHGAQITFDFPSVGATENVLMAAVKADGLTIIENAAREPEVQDLCNMLVEMGASIDGIGEPRLEIRGVDELRAVSWRTCPDRIETGTWAAMAALTRGDVLLEGVRPADLSLPLMKLRAAGATVEEGADSLRVRAEKLTPTNFVTLPYPGFPTDLQPQMTVLLTQAEGTSICTENVFESRFSFIDELRKMNADIELDGHHAVIRGVASLQGAVLEGLDVRAGVAGVMAGLVADGETIVRDVHHIDRGYASFVDRLRAIGGDIDRLPESEVDLPADA